MRVDQLALGPIDTRQNVRKEGLGVDEAFVHHTTTIALQDLTLADREMNPGVNDGAGALVLASEEWAEANGKEVLGTIVGFYFGYTQTSL